MTTYPKFKAIESERAEPGAVYLCGRHRDSSYTPWIGVTFRGNPHIVCSGPVDDHFMRLGGLGSMDAAMQMVGKAEFELDIETATPGQDDDPSGTMYLGPNQSGPLCRFAERYHGILDTEHWTVIEDYRAFQHVAIHSWRLQLPPTAERAAVVLAEFATQPLG